MTFILLSPNHKALGSASVSTTKAKWLTPDGEIYPDLKLSEKLTGNRLAQFENQPFKTEYGIYKLTPFIRYSLPPAKILPLIVKDNLTLAEEKI